MDETEASINVADGVVLVIDGTHEGSIEVEPGGRLEIQGAVRGLVAIGSLGTVVVHGDLVGRVDIRVAGTLIVEPSGRLSGDVTNFGSFTNRGLRAGRVEGRAPDDQPDSVLIEPAHAGGARYQLPQR